MRIQLTVAGAVALLALAPVASATSGDDQDFLRLLHSSAVPIGDGAAVAEAHAVCANGPQPGHVDSASDQTRAEHPDWNPQQVDTFVTAATTLYCAPSAMKVGE